MQRRFGVAHFRLACIFLVAIGAGCTGRAHRGADSGPDQRPAEREGTGQGRAGNGGPSATELWVHGTLSAEDTKRVGARGARAVVNARQSSPEQFSRLLQDFAQHDVGLCLTLRWQSASSERATADEPPSAVEGVRVTEALIEVLNSQHAKDLSGRLWVQFFNEITGGPGRFAPADADRMFEWATEAAQRIRAECPHVKIVGPAIAGAEILAEDGREARGLTKTRREGMLRIIRWSVKYADAVDLHLHVKDAEVARSQLRSVRELMDQESDGRDVAMVVWEWSCAKFPERQNAQAVRAVIVGIWREMVATRVARTAYGGMWVPKGQPEVYQWKNLYGFDGLPNEPFYSTFVDIAQGRVKATSTDR